MAACTRRGDAESSRSVLDEEGLAMGLATERVGPRRTLGG